MRTLKFSRIPMETFVRLPYALVKRLTSIRIPCMLNYSSLRELGITDPSELSIKTMSIWLVTLRWHD